jgi:hypothetical protein
VSDIARYTEAAAKEGLYGNCPATLQQTKLAAELSRKAMLARTYSIRYLVTIYLQELPKFLFFVFIKNLRYVRSITITIIMSVLLPR